jgi:predicted phosphodiesterase
VRKFITCTAVWFISVLLRALIVERARTNPPEPGPLAIPSYAGFACINPNKNHFIIVGDTQSTSRWEFWRERNDKERKLIIDEITKRDPAFVIHLGDLTSHGSSKRQWQQFDELHKEFRAKKIPYFPILGNHEFYGSGEKALQNYYGRFPHLAGRSWYSFTWKNVGFILVDSNFSYLTMEEIEQQGKWYVEQLERFEGDEKIDYVIVCCHEPPFTNSRVVRPNRKVRVFFADPFLKYAKASFFFSGHSHAYERFQIDGKFFIVSGGGGGPRHKVSVDPKNRRYEDLFRDPELRFLHFIEMKVVGSTLAYGVLRLNPDGTFTTTDSLEITKRNENKMPSLRMLS